MTKRMISKLRLLITRFSAVTYPMPQRLEHPSFQPMFNYNVTLVNVYLIRNSLTDMRRSLLINIIFKGESFSNRNRSLKLDIIHVILLIL